MSASATELKMKSPTTLHDKAGHLIRRLHQNMVSTFAELAEEFDLSNVQFAALEAVSDLEPTTQKEVADYIAMEPSNVHGLLKRLRERRLISITADRNDARRNAVRLTKNGWKLLLAVRPFEEQVEPALLESLTDSERVEFLSLMRKLVY